MAEHNVRSAGRLRPPLVPLKEIPERDEWIIGDQAGHLALLSAVMLYSRYGRWDALCERPPFINPPDNVVRAPRSLTVNLPIPLGCEMDLDGGIPPSLPWPPEVETVRPATFLLGQDVKITAAWAPRSGRWVVCDE
jgi:hypothetical protein